MSYVLHERYVGMDREYLFLTKQAVLNWIEENGDDGIIAIHGDRTSRYRYGTPYVEDPALNSSSKFSASMALNQALDLI